MVLVSCIPCQCGMQFAKVMTFSSSPPHSCGFCVPRPQLLKRWLQAGVRMKQITSSLKLIYPPSAHDYEYYKASTVAYFMIDEVKSALIKVLSIVE